MTMSLISEAKKNHRDKINRQFISYYDSVKFLGEPIGDALEFVLANLLNEQIHLKLEFDELSLISVKRYQDDEDGYYYYYTRDFIEKHLTDCIKQGYIDESSPIYNLGFARQSFIDMLDFFEIPISEYELNNTQSPDINLEDNHIEISHNLYRFVCLERDELRKLNVKQNNLIKQLQNEITNLKKELDENTNQPLVETQSYLDPSNKFFSIEMKLCHDTWNHLYKNGVKPRLAHTREVKNYLESYPDLEVNSKAIKRIATITNPKAVLAKSDPDKED